MPPGAKTREGYRAMEKTIGRKLIAERAGVSMRTVTRVLQGDKLVAEQTRLRVLEVNLAIRGIRSQEISAATRTVILSSCSCRICRITIIWKFSII